MILLPDQKILVAWRANNKDHYISKGYKFTSYSDKFYVDAADLHRHSAKRIKANCDLCGATKEVSFDRYMNSIERNNGRYICHKCSATLHPKATLLERQERHYNRALEICNECGYTLVSSKDDITGNASVIEYNCKKHGLHKMKLANLFSGKRCPECRWEESSIRYRKSVEDVIREVEECGGKLINPEEYVNQSTPNLAFICSECGDIFYSSLAHYTQHGGRVCPKCSNYESLGEKKVRYYLESHSIEFEQQKMFTECRDQRMLPFDFYLPTHNTIIEFDGEQHYKEKNYFKNSLEEIRNHDEIKNSFCTNARINLIRIPYNQINHINEILDKQLFT